MVTFVRGAVEIGDPEHDPPIPTKSHATIYHVPQLAQVYRRYLRKSTPKGKAWDCDLTQLATAEWWRTDYQLKPPFGLGGAPVAYGGTSSQLIPLADEAWKISPCARVVFATLDWHDLGPKYQPNTSLCIINDLTGDVLQLKIPLRLNNDTLSSDLYTTFDGLDSFEGDDETQDFELSDPAVSITEVKINGDVTAAWTWDSDHPEIIHFTSTPPSGAEIEVRYVFRTDLLFRAGDHKYGVDGAATEIRCGMVDGKEWALVFVAQQDRSTGTAYPRVVRVEMQAILTAPPVVSVIDFSSDAPSAIAVAGGQLFQASFDSGQWKIRMWT